MKKLLLFVCIIMLGKANMTAQITLDTTIAPWYGFGFDFYTVQISESETKYLMADSASNTFSLYNMDFTPFMVNISVPEPFGPWDFQVIYVTRTLFDCDSTNIEYAYESSLGNNNHPFYIMRTDGTQLFKLDSAIGPWCLGCTGMSDIPRPIRNTSAGAKLFLHRAGGNGQLTNIYSLCGTLPNDVFDFTNGNRSFVKIFPNPTSGILIFQITAPDNVNEYELVVIDGNSKEVMRERIALKNRDYSIDVTNLSSGIYFYSLCTKNKSFQSGRFIINK